MIDYQGAFFDDNVKKELQKLAKQLSGQELFYKTITDIHVTYKFKPEEHEMFDADEIGESVDMEVVGYGNGENFAFEVKTTDPRYRGAAIQHITMFLKNEKSKARNSALLQYKPLKNPLKIKGILGLFTKGTVIAEVVKATAV